MTKLQMVRREASCPVLQRSSGWQTRSPALCAGPRDRWCDPGARPIPRACGRGKLRGDGFVLHRSPHARASPQIYRRSELNRQVQPIRHCRRGDRRRRARVQGVALWDNLDTSIQLHHIKKVIAIDHRDCGAAKIAYGEAKVANPQVETETHKAALAEFRKQVGQRHPQLGVETGLMALDGKMEMFS